MSSNLISSRAIAAVEHSQLEIAARSKNSASQVIGSKAPAMTPEDDRAKVQIRIRIDDECCENTNRH